MSVFPLLVWSLTGLVISSSVIERVQIDVKPKSNTRTRYYDSPGTRLSFPYPQSLEGTLIKCHVQATTDRIQVDMMINGRVLQANRRIEEWDPITDQNRNLERVVTVHTEYDDFIPSASHHRAEMMCRAVTEQEPIQTANMSLKLDVEYPPVGSCKIRWKSYLEKKLLVNCTTSYNPALTDTNWNIPQLGNFDAYYYPSKFIFVTHSISSLYSTDFLLEYQCEDNSEPFLADLSIRNWLDENRLSTEVDCALRESTTPCIDDSTTSTEQTTTSGLLTELIEQFTTHHRQTTQHKAPVVIKFRETTTPNTARHSNPTMSLLIILTACSI